MVPDLKAVLTVLFLARCIGIYFRGESLRATLPVGAMNHFELYSSVIEIADHPQAVWAGGDGSVPSSVTSTLNGGLSVRRAVDTRAMGHLKGTIIAIPIAD